MKKAIAESFVKGGEKLLRMEANIRFIPIANQ